MTNLHACDIMNMQGKGFPFKKGSEEVELNVTEALLKAVLELIDKCNNLDELRESIARIMGK